MDINIWVQDHYIEVFGAIAGIIYVFLEIKQNIWLWPVGIITSGVYIWVFFINKFYADMSLQVYYLVISILGWYWWTRGKGLEEEGTGHRGEKEEGTGYRAQGASKEGDGEKEREGEKEGLKISRLKLETGIYLILVFVFLFAVMRFVLSGLTDSPVPGWDSFITSLSIVATWMLARKIYEHWYLWIVVNSVSVLLFAVKGLYPTVILYFIYAVMSVAGLVEWRKSMDQD